MGVYLDEQGRLPLMSAVRKAEVLMANEPAPHPYLAIEGDAAYRQAVQVLLFGADHEALAGGRVATVQAIGGTGALKIGADFLRRFFPQSKVWVSSPTWDNHPHLFKGAGFEVEAYPYFSPQESALRFEEMLACLRVLPSRSIVVLHGCCHNPTGVDLSREQWEAVVPIIFERGLIPFIDMAYQGFGDGLGNDSFAVRLFAERGVEFLVANSFSKNFSLYGERCGALSFVCANSLAANIALGQAKSIVRQLYSTPPTFGCRIISRVLGSPELRASWEAELASMRERIRDMRVALCSALNQVVPEHLNFDHFAAQRGMFSMTGLNESQVDCLRESYGVYLLRSGRMCMSGLSRDNVRRVANALARVMGAT